MVGGAVGVALLVWTPVFASLWLIPRLIRFIVYGCLAAASGWLFFSLLVQDIGFVRYAVPVTARVVSSPGARFKNQSTWVGRQLRNNRVQTYPHELEFDRHRTVIDLGGPHPVGTTFSAFYNAQDGSDLRLRSTQPDWEDLWTEWLSWRLLLPGFWLLMTISAISWGVDMVRHRKGTSDLRSGPRSSAPA